MEGVTERGSVTESNKTTMKTFLNKLPCLSDSHLNNTYGHVAFESLKIEYGS